MVDERAEHILHLIQGDEQNWFEKWHLEGYIPMEEGVLLYVTRAGGQKVVVSVQREKENVFHLELLRNNDRFDRIVLGGQYDVKNDQLAGEIDRLLHMYH